MTTEAFFAKIRTYADLSAKAEEAWASLLRSRQYRKDEPFIQAGGLEVMVLSQTGSAVQAELDADIATKRARENNDYLAKQIQRRPHAQRQLRNLGHAFAETGRDGTE